MIMIALILLSMSDGALVMHMYIYITTNIYLAPHILHSLAYIHPNTFPYYIYIYIYIYTYTCMHIHILTVLQMHTTVLCIHTYQYIYILVL